MRLSAEQETHLRNVRKADIAWRNAKRDARARARILAEKEVAGYLAARDHEVRLAFEAGVPKTALRVEGLGTTSPKTLEDSLARTARNLDVETFEGNPLAHRYNYDAATKELVVTLDGDALSRAALEQNSTALAIRHLGLDSAKFERSRRKDGSYALTPLSPFWVDEHSIAHPVVWWLSQPENEAEALEWIAGRVA